MVYNVEYVLLRAMQLELVSPATAPGHLHCYQLEAACYAAARAQLIGQK